MQIIGVIITFIGGGIVFTHGGRRWYGPNADEKNKEDLQYVLMGVGIIVLGAYLMTH